MADTPAAIVQTAAGQLKLSGRIDLNTTTALMAEGQRLIEASTGDISIDLRESSFRGAGGLSLLVAWMKVANRNQRALHCVGIPESLTRIAGAYGMMELLELEALASGD